MRYIKGVYQNKNKFSLFGISMFLCLIIGSVLALVATVQAVVDAPVATVSRTSDKESDARQGDTIRYTVRIKRLDTVGTQTIKIVESLPQELVYLGNERINYGDIVDFRRVQVNEDNYNLEFKIDLTDYIGNMNTDLVLSYDVQVGEKPEASSTINTISHLYCYDMPSEGIQPTVGVGTYVPEEGNIIYSKTATLNMIRYADETIYTNIGTKIIWEGVGNIPEYVDVRLYKNNEPYSSLVRLSAANNWEYSWSISEYDILPATPSVASPSSAENYSSVQWYVKQETPVNGYSTSLGVVQNNMFVFVNRYGSGTFVPDHGGTSPGSTSLGSTSSGSSSSGSTSSGSRESGSSSSGIGNNNLRNISPASSENTASVNKSEKYRLDHFDKLGDFVRFVISEDVDGADISANNAKDGAIITYHIKLENIYNKDLLGLRVREYMPAYTHYYSHNDPRGEYGYVNGDEHITWFIPVLKAGEKIELEFKVSKDYCVQGSIATRLYYEVTGSEIKPYSNITEDPVNIVELD